MFATVFWLAYLGWGQAESASLSVRWVSAVACAITFAGALTPRRLARVHLGLAAAVLLLLAGFAGSRAVGAWPFAWDALPDARYAAFIGGAAALTALALLRCAFWARWTAIALAAGSALGGALNSINLRHARDESAWLAAMAVLGGLTLLSQLLRPEGAARCSRGARHSLWASRDRLVVLARWSAIASFAAASMLVLYALGQPVAPATAPWALALAPLLGLGSVLVLRQRGAGIVVLGLGGLALLGLTAASALIVDAANLPIVGYYACFWGPAALASLLSATLALTRARQR